MARRLIAAALLAMAWADSAQAEPWSDCRAACGVAERINAYRGELERGCLIADPTLRTAAERYAAVMAAEGEMGHHVDGGNVLERAFAAGFMFDTRGGRVGENVFYAGGCDQRFASDVDGFADLAVLRWRESSGHDTNMRDPGWRAMGVGVAQSADGDRCYAAATFATSRAAGVVKSCDCECGR